MKARSQERSWRDRFAAVPVDDKGGQWQPRYYQHNAITRSLSALMCEKSLIANQKKPVFSVKIYIIQSLKCLNANQPT